MNITFALSPFTGKVARKIDSIPVQIIIDEYQNLIQYDVKNYFENIRHIDIYECLDTGFRFYHPFIEGKPDLYERLSKMNGYYPLWKWENTVAYKSIQEKTSVLDIGCGNGEFLKKIKDDFGCDITGLEFNDKALAQCKAIGVPVFNETIESYSEKHQAKYDVVCAFQVLEHVSNPKSFLEGAIRSLKENGKLIIGVPNNFPHIFKYGKYHPLNMPPHHCGMWNKESLTSLRQILNIEVEEIHEEKINSFADYFFMPYLYVKFYFNKAKYDSKKYGMMKWMNNKPLSFIISLFTLNKRKLRGHTIVSIFRKM